MDKKNNQPDNDDHVPPLSPALDQFVDMTTTVDDDNEHAEILQQQQQQFSGGSHDFKSRLQQYFVDNQQSSLRIRLFNVIIKLIACTLYCIQVIRDSGQVNTTGDDQVVDDTDGIRFEFLIWVDRDHILWLCQTSVAVVSLTATVLIFYVSYKGNLFRLLLSIHFLLELLTSVPFVVTIFVPAWRQLYSPVFLNCWLAKRALEAMLNDLNRASQVQQSALFRQMLLLLSTVICLIFTGTCGIQHLQRAGTRKFDLFSSLYFVIVTLSTVGYGDIYPDYWCSRLYVVLLISVALAVLPSQIESLGQKWIERQRAGAGYNKGWTKFEQHVVVTVTDLDADAISDFLNEFYTHYQLQTYNIVLLSPCELDNRMRMLLQIPIWAERVTYVRGSALKDDDLERARIQRAKACFILSARNIKDKNAVDEHTILRSWAVKDFAPDCPQYVQIFRPETKMHMEHAECVICEGEFKYSLLSNNCICPGISTFISLLMHTSRGEEGQKSTEPWHRLYGFHSGNEIYDIRLGDSRFFAEYEGKSFTYASFNVHRKFGVGLLGVKRDAPGSSLLLNPGPSFVLRSTDTCYYMGLTSEEELPIESKKLTRARSERIRSSIKMKTDETIAMVNTNVDSTDAGKRHHNRNELIVDDSDRLKSARPSIAPVADLVRPQVFDESSSDEDKTNVVQHPLKCDICGPSSSCIADNIVIGYPPVTSYIGTSATVCYLLKKRRESCCLQLSEPCIHCRWNNANQYGWKNPAIILAVDKTSSGIYNFIIPLRAHYRPVHELNPIILLLELQEQQQPNASFLDIIAWFPQIYWLQGKISNLDNLLKAGVCIAEHVVVVKEGFMAVEQHMADCKTIITVQKIHRMFPILRIITELTHSSNMRFMQFNANCNENQSKFEKEERENGSHLAFMFRLPFAAGTVFSANMLDRLLYQTFVKHYLVRFIRLMLGIDQTFSLKEDDMWIRTYGRLYQKLCSSVGDMPIGIYRTQQMDPSIISIDMQQQCADEFSSSGRERRDISDMVRSRMRNMGMFEGDYKYRSEESRATISFVIINPSFDLPLQTGDVVYLLKAPTKRRTMSTNDRRRCYPRRGMQTRLSAEGQLMDDSTDRNRSMPPAAV